MHLTRKSALTQNTAIPRPLEPFTDYLFDTLRCEHVVGRPCNGKLGLGVNCCAGLTCSTGKLLGLFKEGKCK